MTKSWKMQCLLKIDCVDKRIIMRQEGVGDTHMGVSQLVEGTLFGKDKQMDQIHL